jgi:hypothetical protein
MTIPDPPDTPPRGGAHLHVDPASLAERAIDHSRDAKKIAMHADDRSAEALSLSKKHAEMIELLPAMKVQLDLALRPTITPGYIRASTLAAAAAMVVSAFALVALVALVYVLARPSSSVSPSGANTQAVYRVP